MAYWGGERRRINFAARMEMWIKQNVADYVQHIK